MFEETANLWNCIQWVEFKFYKSKVLFKGSFSKSISNFSLNKYIQDWMFIKISLFLVFVLSSFDNIFINTYEIGMVFHFSWAPEIDLLPIQR